MKITKFKHVNVKPDGTFKDQRGAVITEGAIRMSQKGGGCDLKGCHCSDGHWLTIVKPRTKKGVVEGTTVTFDDQEEMDVFLKTRELSI